MRTNTNQGWALAQHIYRQYVYSRMPYVQETRHITQRKPIKMCFEARDKALLFSCPLFRNMARVQTSQLLTSDGTRLRPFSHNYDTPLIVPFLGPVTFFLVDSAHKSELCQQVTEVWVGRLQYGGVSTPKRSVRTQCAEIMLNLVRTKVNRLWCCGSNWRGSQRRLGILPGPSTYPTPN